MLHNWKKMQFGEVELFAFFGYKSMIFEIFRTEQNPEGRGPAQSEKIQIRSILVYEVDRTHICYCTIFPLLGNPESTHEKKLS